MKAVRVQETGSLAGLSVAETDPPALQPGEVRIAVKACGINFADVLMVRGLYQEKPELPFIPGIEVAGEVIEIGEGVQRLKRGARVAAIVQRGGLAEEVAVAEAMAVPIPDTVDFITAAAFPVAYGTSHMALTHRAGLQSGETLLVLGAGGGVGLAAVEIGKHLGARVIAAASNSDKLDLALTKGADEAVDYRREDLRERVKALTEGRGADVILDPVGGRAFEASLRAITFEGRMVILGFASGEIGQVPANILLVKNIAVMGLYWGAYASKRPDVLTGSMETLLGWLGEGVARPHVSATHTLTETHLAMEALAERQATGKVVVTMS